MKCLRPLFIPFFLLLPLVSRAQEERSKSELKHFVSCLVGDFTQGTKTGLDTGITALRLHHVFLDAWPNSDSTAWVYEEINYLKNEDKGFRQMVLQVQLLDSGKVMVNSFLIQKPWLFKNAYKDESLKRQLNPEYLSEAKPCALIFKQTEKNQYMGLTDSAGCPNRFHNAVRYTTVARLNEGSYLFWDRGWDAMGTQTWGKLNEGYLFVRTLILTDVPFSGKKQVLLTPE